MKKLLLLFLLSLLLHPLFAADYYWIGGNGSWSNISNWATTSGGTVTHNTAPSAEDNVIFDSNSFSAPGQTVTVEGDIAFCRDMRWESGTQGAIFNGASSATLNIYGSLQLSEEMDYTFRGDVRFQGNNTDNSINLAGQEFLQNVTFDGGQAEWIMSSELQVRGLLNYFGGSLSTAGYAIICERLFVDIGPGNSVLNLNGSTITLTGIDNPSENLPHTVYLSVAREDALVMDQSHFIINGSQSTFRYYHLDGFPSGIGSLTFKSETGESAIRGAVQHPMVFGRLEIQNNAQVDVDLELDSMILGGGKNFIFVSGRRVAFLNLIVEGSCQEPSLIQSDRRGAPFIMNAPVGSNIDVSYVSMQDVVATGGGTFLAENSVDLGNNPGWTINTKNYSVLYWVGGTGMWDNPANWSFSSGGPGGACIPTPGEDVVFDSNSFSNVMDIVMINVENAYCRDFRWQGVTGMPSLNGGIDQNIRIFGSLALSDQMSYNFAGDLYFQSNEMGKTILTAGQEIKKDILFQGSGGWTLEDDLFLLKDLFFHSGTFNTNDQELRFREFRSEVVTERKLFLTNSKIILKDTLDYRFLSWRMNNINLEFDAGTSTVIFNNTGSVELSGRGTSRFHHLIMRASGLQNNFTNGPEGYLGMDTLELYGWHRFNNHIYPKHLIINPGYELRISEQDTLSFDSLVVPGGCGAYAEITSTTINEPVIIRPTRPNQISHLIIRDLQNNTGIPLTLTASVDLGNNKGWSFTQEDGRELYWVGNGGEWNDPAHWSLNSGGAGGECPPGPRDNVYFDANSFSTTGQVVQGRASFTYCRNMDWSSANFKPTFEFYEHQNFGSIHLIDEMNFYGIRLKGRTDSVDMPIDTRGHAFSYLTLEGNGSWVLSSTLDVFSFEFQAGELTTKGQEIFTERVDITGRNLKTLDMRNTYWHFEGKRSDYNQWFVAYRTMKEVIVDNSVVELESESPEIRLYGAFSFDHLLASSTTGSTELNNYIHNNPIDAVRFNTLELRNNTVFSGSMYGDTILLAAGKTFQLDPNAELRGNKYIQMIGNNCTPIELKSKFSGQQADLVSPQGIVKADFVQLQDIRAVGNEPFYAGVHSTDISNNTNWIFDSAEEFVEEGFLGPDKVLCHSTRLSLDANNFSPGETYLWQDGSTDSIMLVDQPGLYFVEVNFTNNCVIRDSVNVLAPEEFSPNLPDTLNLLCEGDTLVLDGSLDLVGLSYLWQDSSRSSRYQVIQEGEYKVTLELGGCFASDSTQVQMVALPQVDLGKDQIICADSSFVLKAMTQNATFRWQDNSRGSTFEGNSPGIYWVDASFGKCTTRDSVRIEYYEPILLELGEDTTICEQSSISITGNLASAEYLWSDGSTGNSITVSDAGVYTVEARVNTCPAYDTITIFVQELPRFELGPDTAICRGESLVLDGTSIAGATYEWSDGSREPTLEVNVEGSYGLQARIGTCTFTDAKFIRIKPLPVVNLGADRLLCEGDTEILDVAQEGATYRWQDGSTSETFTATDTDTFGVTVYLDGCQASDSLYLRFKPAPEFDLGNDTLLCQGESLLLNGFVNATTAYNWNTGSRDPSISVTTAGLYSLETTDDGCTFRDEISVEYAFIPENLLGMDRILCEEEVLEFNLNVEKASGYEWMDGTLSADYLISSEGTYGVRVSVDRCTGGDTINVSYNPLPRFDLGADTSLCEGETVSLRINTLADTYQWQDGSKLSEYQVAFPGTYTASATLDGCTFTDEILVDYQAIRPFSLGPDTTICEEEPFFLSIDQPADRIEWQDGTSFREYAVPKAGIYSVTVEDGACSSSDTIVIQTRDCYRFRIYAPSAFSPNSDGINDEFLIGIPPNMRIISYEMEVFDRWGDRVFASQDINEGWDGFWGGEKLPVGVYIYTVRIRYRDDFKEDEKRYSGDVLLLK